MPNFLKKAEKRTREVCAEDETAIAALFVRPAGDGKTKRLGTPGGALAKVGPLADQVSTDTDHPGATLFAQNAVLILTDSRLLAFGHGSLTGRIGKLTGQVDLADVAALSLEMPEGAEQDASESLRVEFSDGTVAWAAPGSRRQRFLDAFASASEISPN